MSKPRIVILGAGPAGLGAAYRLANEKRAEVVVLERNEMVGGNAGSFDFGGQRVDFGSHRLHPSTDPEVLEDIQEFLGTDLLRRPRNGRIRLRGRWVRFPLKPIDLLLRLDRRFAMGVIWDMARGALPGGGPREETFAEVLRAHLGPTICEHFYFPYARKIWGLEPEELSATQAYKRVSAGSFGKLLRKVFSGLPGVKPLGYDYFYYPRRGFGQISQGYAEAAERAGAEILKDRPVVGLTRPESGGGLGWEVTVGGGDGDRVIGADQVWSTIPVTLLARLTRTEAAERVGYSAEGIRYRSMILVYLKLGVARFTDFDAHYFPGSDVAITRLSEPKHYVGGGNPADTTVLCAELPCSPDDEVWGLDREQLAARVIEDLEHSGLPLPGDLLETEVRRLPQAYPIYDRGYEEHLQRLDAWAESEPGLLTYGRQGLFAHDNTHHALFMGYSAAECLDGAEFNEERWGDYRTIFESHVVED